MQRGRLWVLMVSKLVCACSSTGDEPAHRESWASAHRNAATCQPDSRDRCNACAAWQKCQAETSAFAISSQWDMRAMEGEVSGLKPDATCRDAAGSVADPGFFAPNSGAPKCTTVPFDARDPQRSEELFSRMADGTLRYPSAVGVFLRLISMETWQGRSSALPQSEPDLPPRPFQAFARVR